jgi:hypothetical protein
VRIVVQWLRKHVVAVGLLAVVGAGCGETNDDSRADVTTTASPVTTAGSAAFVANARALTFGSKDLGAASDRELLRLGKVICVGLGIEELGFSGVI